MLCPSRSKDIPALQPGPRGYSIHADLVAFAPGITRCICCGTPSAWPALVSGRGVSCVGWYPRPPPRPHRRRRMHPPGVSQEPCVTGPAAHPCPRQPWLRCSISAIGEVRSVEMTAQCSLVPLPSSCCPSAPRPRRSSLRSRRSCADCCRVTAAACSAAPRKPGSFWPSAPTPCVSGPGRSATRPTRPRRRRAPPCTSVCHARRVRSRRASRPGVRVASVAFSGESLPPCCALSSAYLPPSVSSMQV